MRFTFIDLLIGGHGFRVYEPSMTLADDPLSRRGDYLKMTMIAYIPMDSYNRLAKTYNNGTPSGTVINDEIHPDAVSFEDWAKSIAKGKDVYLPSDILLKALKEYFDKILTTNDKE